MSLSTVRRKLNVLRRGPERRAGPVFDAIFDAEYYRAKAPDVAQAGVDAKRHYIERGWIEGRNPSLVFDTDWYLERHPDVFLEAVNPLIHYADHGGAERRQPHPLFDAAWYLDENDDVAAAGANPLAHFLSHGWREGRSPHRLFDLAYYEEQMSPNERGRINPLLHYLAAGWSAALDPSLYFASRWYRERNENAAAAGLTPLEHYLRNGWRDGRAPNPGFDPSDYRAQRPELETRGVDPLTFCLMRDPAAANALRDKLSGKTRRASVAAASAPRSGRWIGSSGKPVIVFESHNLKQQGAPNSLFEIAAGIASGGVYEPVFSSAAEGPLLAACESAGVETAFHGVRRSDVARASSDASRDAAIDRLAAFYRSLGAAIIHVNTLQNFHAVLAAERAGAPAIWNIRESEDPSSYFDDLPPSLRGIAYSCFSKAAKVVFVADATKRLWSERFPEAKNFVRIHNGVDLTRLKQRAARADRILTRREIGADANDVVFLNVGTVGERKGQRDIVDAAARLPDGALRKAVFVIVGMNESAYSREIEAEFEALKERGARFVGVDETKTEIGRDLVAALYAASDAFILTSRIESYPRVTLEAMGFGLPIVTTPCFGVREQLEDGESALFYDAGEADLLAARIRSIVEDPIVRETLATAAEDRLKSLNDYHAMVTAYTDLYRELVPPDKSALARKTGEAARARRRPREKPLGPVARSLSILVISRTPANMSRLLAAIAASRIEVDHEVICSWNGEAGAENDIIVPDRVAFRLIERRPYHFAGNNNRLAREARGELVLFINDDVVPDPDAINIAICEIANPGVGLLGANLRYENGRIQHAGVFFNDDGQPYHRLKNKALWTDKRFAADEFTPAVTGAFIMIRREEFLAIGFDEAFKVCGEDIALNLAYREKFDREILFCSGASGVHVENATRRTTGETKTPAEDMTRIQSYVARRRDGASLTEVRRPKVRIATEKPGWIMHRKAEEIQKHMGSAHVVINQDWDEADIHYFINFHHMREKPAHGLVVANFTHFDPDSPSAKFQRAAKEVDHCVSVSEATTADLKRFGADDAKITTIVVGADAAFEPKLTLGVVGRVYEGGRKGEDLVQALLDDPEVSAVTRIVAAREGWGAPVWSFDQPADFYRAIDCLLVPSRVEGGPVPFMEALACGVLAIAPPIGVIPQFPHVGYPVGDLQALRATILRVAQERLAERRKIAAHMRGLDWAGWSVEHEKLFRALIWRRDKGEGEPTPPASMSGAAQRSSGAPSFAFMTTNDNTYSGGSEVWWRETAARLLDSGAAVSIIVRRWEPKPSFLDDLEEKGAVILYKEEDGFQRALARKPALFVLSTGDQDDGIEFFRPLIDADQRYVIVNRLTKETRFWPIRHAKQQRVVEGYSRAEKVFFASANNHRVMEERIGRDLPSWDRIFSPNHADRTAGLAWPDGANGLALAFPANVNFIHKGHDILIDVLDQQKWRERTLTVNIYGSGRDLDRLQSLISERNLDSVELRGPFVQVGAERKISDIWRHNHAILAPSRMEGFANMVLNAMISARVPIVTDIGGHGEIIKDGETGFIAPNPTAEDFDAALERAWTMRNAWRSIGERARQAALDYLPEDPVGDAADKLLAVAADFPTQESWRSGAKSRNAPI